MVECTIDDIIILGRHDTEHLQTLETVLQRLDKAGLRVNLAKCKFFQEKIEYCGHAIDAKGLHTLPSKVEAVVQAPPPTDVSQVRSFVGLVTYYQRFIPDMSTVLSPITELLQKGAEFTWTAACQQAFDRIKQLLSSTQILAHYNPDLPVRLASDASPYGNNRIGAVLSHVYPSGEERPIAYASRKLSKTERSYSQIDREALAIVWSVKKFHTYLYGRHFELLTDHQPLVSIFNPSKSLPAMTTARLQQYAVFLAGHQYSICYRNTHDPRNADGLSRLPYGSPHADDAETAVDVFYAQLAEPLPVTAKELRHSTRCDPVSAEVTQYVHHGWPAACPKPEKKPFWTRRHALSLSQDCLLWGNRVVIPPPHQRPVHLELHEGHPGIVRMKAIARSYVWWPNMDSQLEETVKACIGCQETRSAPPVAPVHPWMWPRHPWHRLHIDFLGPLRDCMWLVVVDAHSKWPETIRMPSTTAQATVNQLRTLFARFGCPHEIVSDNGPQFTAAEFQELMKQNGIKHRRSAPYHPATNGQAERFVQAFKRAISATATAIPVQEAADRFLMSYRNCTHPTTAESPAKLLLGRPLRTRLDLLRPNRQGQVEGQQDRQAISRQTHTRRSFQPGDPVMARDYRTQHHPSWLPGTVLSVEGPLSYLVETKEGATWKRHIDQLRPGHSTFLSPEGGEDDTIVGIQPENQTTATPADVASDETPEPEAETPIVTQPVLPASPKPAAQHRHSSRIPKPVNRMNL